MSETQYRVMVGDDGSEPDEVHVGGSLSIAIRKLHHEMQVQHGLGGEPYDRGWIERREIGEWKQFGHLTVTKLQPSTARQDI